MLKKKKDPMSFTIPYMIGDFINEKSIADFEASINAMPYTMFAKLGLSDLQPTRMTFSTSR